MSSVIVLDACVHCQIADGTHIVVDLVGRIDEITAGKTEMGGQILRVV